MPAAIAIPAIASVVAGVGGAALAAKSSSNASKSSLKGQSAALAYEREKDAKAEAEFKRRELLQKAQFDAWNSNRRALARRYGINMPEPAMGAPAGPRPAGPGLTLGAIARPRPAGPPDMPALMQAPEAQSGFDPQGWENWDRYATVR